MQISVAGIQAAGSAYAAANGAMTVFLFLLLVLLLWALSKTQKAHGQETDKAAKDTAAFAAVIVFVLILFTLPTLMWFVWNSVIAIMAPEFFVLQKLN